jgi:hypothetical protein
VWKNFTIDLVMIFLCILILIVLSSHSHQSKRAEHRPAMQSEEGSSFNAPEVSDEHMSFAPKSLL